MAHYQIVIDIDHEPGTLPKMQVKAPNMSGPDLFFHLRNVCDMLQTQIIMATVLERLGKGPDTAGRVVIPGLVPPSGPLRS